MPGADCFVSGALAASLRVSRLVGLAPLAFFRERDGWRVSRSNALCITANILVTLLIVICIVTLIADHGGEDYKGTNMKLSKKYSIGWLVDIILNMIIVFTSVYGASSQMERMFMWLKHLQNIYCRLYINYRPRFFEKIKMSLLIYTILSTVALTLADLVLKFMQADDLRTFLVGMLYISVYLLYYIMKVQMLQFIMIAMHVWNAFRVINDELKMIIRVLPVISDMMQNFQPFENMLVTTNEAGKKKNVNTVRAAPPIESVVPPGRRHHETVHELSVAFSDAYVMVRELNQFYGKILLMMLTIALLKLVLAPYFLICIYVGKANEYLGLYISRLVIQILWCLYHGVNFIILIEPCHMTHVEVEKTRNLLSHLMYRTTSAYDPLAVELELFHRLLVPYEALYCPLRITTMSRSLTLTIFGTITTYLVIIMQL